MTSSHVFVLRFPLVSRKTANNVRFALLLRSQFSALNIVRMLLLISSVRSNYWIRFDRHENDIWGGIILGVWSSDAGPASPTKPKLVTFGFTFLQLNQLGQLDLTSFTLVIAEPQDWSDLVGHNFFRQVEIEENSVDFDGVTHNFRFLEKVDKIGHFFKFRLHFTISGRKLTKNLTSQRLFHYRTGAQIDDPFIYSVKKLLDLVGSLVICLSRPLLFVGLSNCCHLSLSLLLFKGLHTILFSHLLGEHALLLANPIFWVVKFALRRLRPRIEQALPKTSRKFLILVNLFVLEKHLLLSLLHGSIVGCLGLRVNIFYRLISLRVGHLYLPIQL